LNLVGDSISSQILRNTVVYWLQAIFNACFVGYSAGSSPTKNRSESKAYSEKRRIGYRKICRLICWLECRMTWPETR
jgi:hypothetical protein